MNEATTARLAERLRDLSDGDRDWLLAALAPEECRIVSAALRVHRLQTLVERPSAEIKNTPSTQRLDDVAARLDAAELREIVKVFGGLPEWAIALVLSTYAWRWARAFLGEQPAERVKVLRSLAIELECVKPAVRAVLLRELADQLQPAVPRSAAASTFDAALEHALESHT